MTNPRMKLTADCGRNSRSGASKTIVHKECVARQSTRRSVFLHMENTNDAASYNVVLKLCVTHLDGRGVAAKNKAEQ